MFRRDRIYSNIPSNCINFNDLCLWLCLLFSVPFQWRFIASCTVCVWVCYPDFKVIILFKRVLCNLSKPLLSVCVSLHKREGERAIEKKNAELTKLVKNSNYSFRNLSTWAPDLHIHFSKTFPHFAWVRRWHEKACLGFCRAQARRTKKDTQREGNMECHSSFSFKSYLKSNFTHPLEL